MPGYIFKGEKKKTEKNKQTKNIQCTSQFYLIKVGFEGGLNYMGMLA